MDETDAYLEMLFADSDSDELLEVRSRAGARGMRCEFFPLSDRDGAAARIHELAPHGDVYVGCAPRTRRAGTRDAVAPVRVLWVDCDSEHSSAAARAWTPAPTMLVASGSPGGLHAYWRLATPVEPQAAEAANLRLAATLGADPLCFDAARILRPAGTLNHKHEPPMPVSLERWDASTRLEPRTVVSMAPVVRGPDLDRRWQRKEGRDANGDPLLRIPPPVYVMRLLGRAPGRDGKVTCPFHDDERPSLHVYREPGRGWCCYSCGRGGSVYDLGAALWGFNTRGGDFLRLRRRLMDTLVQDRGRSL